jgi:hypothetical protein
VVDGLAVVTVDRRRDGRVAQEPLHVLGRLLQVDVADVVADRAREPGRVEHELLVEVRVARDGVALAGGHGVAERLALRLHVLQQVGGARLLLALVVDLGRDVAACQLPERRLHGPMLDRVHVVALGGAERRLGVGQQLLELGPGCLHGLDDFLGDLVLGEHAREEAVPRSGVETTVRVADPGDG